MHKEVLFPTKSGLKKFYKGLIFISEKAWAPCRVVGALADPGYKFRKKEAGWGKGANVKF